ncbi:MAG: alpha/beta fold hydrolase [Chromatiales bacterium]
MAKRAADLVFVHGWGFGHGVWRPLLETLPPTLSASAVDLPGYGNDEGPPPASVAGIAQVLATAGRPPAVWVGWSLGGMVVLELAAARPNLIKEVILVGVNARFVAAPGWPHAVPAIELQRMRDRLERNPRATLLQFARLAARAPAGTREAASMLLDSLDCTPLPALPTLRAGLQALVEADQRAALSHIRCPVRLVLGDHDALVPLAAAEAMGVLNPALAVTIIAGAGHALPLSHHTALLQLIGSMIT